MPVLPPGLLSGPGAEVTGQKRVTTGSASQRADAGTAFFLQNYRAIIGKPQQHMESSEELFHKH